MKIRNIAQLCLFNSICGLCAASPTVTINSAMQRYPWNGMVDVSFTAENVVEGKNKLTVEMKDVVGGTNLIANSMTYGGSAVVNGSTSVTNGINTLIWDAQKDLPKDFVLERVGASVTVNPYTLRLSSTLTAAVARWQMRYLIMEQPKP